jgi:hypothetical protein
VFLTHLLALVAFAFGFLWFWTSLLSLNGKIVKVVEVVEVVKTVALAPVPAAHATVWW